MVILFLESMKSDGSESEVITDAEYEKFLLFDRNGIGSTPQRA